MRNRLPHLPSDLLETALNDLNKVERSAKYRVDMNQWHAPNSHCKVCLAGAVMAMTLEVPAKQDRYPRHFRAGTRNKLVALDYFRLGIVCDGLAKMNFYSETWASQGHNILVPKYSKNRKGFKLALRKLVRALRKEGL